MALDQETVRRIATLARIKIPEKKISPLADELNNIFVWIEQLSEVHTDGIEPMTSVVKTIRPQHDSAIPDCGASEQILQNAPETETRFFCVPKVIE